MGRKEVKRPKEIKLKYARLSFENTTSKKEAAGQLDTVMLKCLDGFINTANTMNLPFWIPVKTRHIQKTSV